MAMSERDLKQISDEVDFLYHLDRKSGVNMSFKEILYAAITNCGYGNYTHTERKEIARKVAAYRHRNKKAA